VLGAGKRARFTEETPDALSARRRLRVYFLASALAAPLAALLIASLARSGGVAWLAACVVAGVLVAVAASALAMRRVVNPLHGIAEGLARSASNADQL